MKNLRNWAVVIALAVFVAGAAALEAQGTGWASLFIQESSGAVQSRVLGTYGAPLFVGRGTATPTVANSGSPPMEGELFVVTGDSIEPELLLYSVNTGAFTSVVTSVLLANLAGDANSIQFASNQINFEGATADAFEGILTWDDLDVDVSYFLSQKPVADSVVLLDTGADPAHSVELPDKEFAPAITTPGRDKVWFRTAPTYSTSGPAANTGAVAACSTTGSPNWLYGPAITGFGFEMDIKGTATECGPDYVAADGMGLHNDDADAEGWELTQGITDGAPGAFTVGTSPAFYAATRFAVGDTSDTDQCLFGFRKVEAYQDATLKTYTDYFAVGIGDIANGGDGDWQVFESLNDTSAETDIAETDMTDNQVHSVEVRVSATGVATGFIEGTVITDSGVAMTFDDTEIVVPFFWCLASTGAGDVDVDVIYWESGVQDR